MKKLGLGGGAALQRPFAKNPNFFYKMKISTLVLPLTFFHFCSQRLGVVCVVFYNVLCCLNFGIWIWIIELIFFPFFLFFNFSSPFTFFQSLFSPLHAYFLCLLSYCCLIILLCFVLPQVVASSPCHVVSLHCLIIISSVPRCVASLCCLKTLPHASSHYLFRLVTLPYSFASLPHHVVSSLLCVVSLFHVLHVYLIALAGYLTLLPSFAASKYFMTPPPPPPPPLSSPFSLSLLLFFFFFPPPFFFYLVKCC